MECKVTCVGKEAFEQGCSVSEVYAVTNVGCVRQKDDAMTVLILGILAEMSSIVNVLELGTEQLLFTVCGKGIGSWHNNRLLTNSLWPVKNITVKGY
jgi:hypothetical protein